MIARFRWNRREAGTFQQASNLYGGRMNSYELRVIHPHARNATVYASSHVSDFAAIRRAMSLADEDQVIEVWRGAVCVYSGAPAMALAS